MIMQNSVVLSLPSMTYRILHRKKKQLVEAEHQIVGTPTPMTHNFSKWRVTVKVYAPGWRIIKIKNLPTNFNQPVPLSFTMPLKSLQTEYWKRHQTTASLRVQNIADSGGRTSTALPSVAASD